MSAVDAMGEFFADVDRWIRELVAMEPGHAQVLEAWATSAAALFAATAAFFAYRAFAKERANENRLIDASNSAAEREQRAQANLVAAWMDEDPSNHVPVPLVRNGSELPIYHVILDYFDENGLKLGSSKSDPESTLRVYAPGTVKTYIPDEVLDSLKAAGKGYMDSIFLGVAISFADTSGVQWHRTAAGQLRRAEVNSPTAD